MLSAIDSFVLPFHLPMRFCILEELEYCRALCKYLLGVVVEVEICSKQKLHEIQNAIGHRQFCASVS